MKEPVLCNCGKWFSLHKGFISSEEHNVIICPECHKLESAIWAIKDHIENIEDQMQIGYLKKRDGKKQIRELKIEYKRLTGIDYEV